MTAGSTGELDLTRVWDDACRSLSVPDRAHALERVLAHYRDPTRTYHGVAHLQDVVAGVLYLAEAQGLDRVSRAVAVFAAFFHDAVQEPRVPDNEYRSGELARSLLLDCGMTRPHVDRVVRAVNATAAHRGEEPEQQVLVDADLAILGSEPERYARYVAGVRAEHSHLSDDEFARGRRAVLHHLLDRPEIYLTATQRARLEDRARANLAAELDGMAQSGAPPATDGT